MARPGDGPRSPFDLGGKPRAEAANGRPPDRAGSSETPAALLKRRGERWPSIWT